MPVKIGINDVFTISEKKNYFHAYLINLHQRLLQLITVVSSNKRRSESQNLKFLINSK